MRVRGQRGVASVPETPPGLHKCKKSPFRLAAWAEFHKGPLCGAYTPPNTHTDTHIHTLTYTHLLQAPCLHRTQTMGVSGQQSHIHVNLKYFIRTQMFPRFACSAKDGSKNSFYFPSVSTFMYIYSLYIALFNCYMVLHHEED